MAYVRQFLSDRCESRLVAVTSHRSRLMIHAKTALVLGASGGIGGETMRQLVAAGWTVRALKRGLAAPSETRDGVLWLRGDALVREDVLRAAADVSVIVHAVNPPGYLNWKAWVLP